MGRPAADPLRLFDRIRREIDGICLRTTVIVGFPGETDREFRALRRFVERAQVDRLGIFAYSAEEGTPAARMPDQVPERVRQERLAELAAIQAGVSRENLKNRVGRTYDLLVEGRSGRFLVGRTEYEAPGIDGVVRVRTERRIDPGTFIRVTITASDDHDLEGVVCAD